MKRFITPRLLWAALLAAAVGGAVYGILGSAAPHSRTTAWFRLLAHPLNFAAYGVAFYLCRLISADYRSPSTMRLAWNLMAASSLTAIVRYAYEFFVGLAGLPTGSRFLSLVAQGISTNLAILLLLGSLLLMWSSFAQFGMGFKLRRGQLVLILAILLMVPPLLWRMELYRAGPDLDAVMRELSRMMTPVLLAMVGALGVLLFSVSEEMGRGTSPSHFIIWLRSSRSDWDRCSAAHTRRLLMRRQLLRSGSLSGGPSPGYSHWRWCTAGNSPWRCRE